MPRDKHKSINCTNVAGVDERRKLLSEKRLCFNCTGPRHRADECNRKHTSICHDREDKINPLLVTTGIPSAHVTYPVVVVQVEGIKCRALLDTGAGNSYASAALLERISRGKRKKEVTKIEMLLGASTREVELATIEISDINKTKLTKVSSYSLITQTIVKWLQVIHTYPAS